MSNPARRVVFNPTSIPELRPKRSYIQPARSIPGRAPTRLPRKWAWSSVRKESTEIGKNHTGHIEAHPNEGILFFDSERRPPSGFLRARIDAFRHIPTTIWLRNPLEPPIFYPSKPRRAAQAFQQRVPRRLRPDDLGEACHTTKRPHYSHRDPATSEGWRSICEVLSPAGHQSTGN